MNKTGDGTNDARAPQPVLREMNIAFSSLSDDEAAVLNLDSREFFTLNATGKVVLSALEEGADLQEIVERVAREFEVTVDDCRGDVDQFIDALEGAGIVEFR